jgi:ribosomal protein L44E
MSATIYSPERYASLTPEQKQGRKDSTRQYYEKNKEKILAQQRASRDERRKEAMRKYYQNHRDEILARHKERYKAEIRFKCEVCGQNYQSEANLKDHYKSQKHLRNARLAKWLKTDKDKEIEKDKRRYILNQEQLKKKIQCLCGGKYLPHVEAEHLNSKHHIKYLNTWMEYIDEALQLLNQ